MKGEELMENNVEELMHSGKLYYENKELLKEQAKYRDFLYEFNQTVPSNQEKKAKILAKLLGSFGENSYIEPPLRANWGKNTYFGKNVYVNFNLSLVDDTKITIMDDVMIGPNVTICTAGHPLDPVERRTKAQYNLPVVIGENVWIGANVVILPGVTIGENTVIGAGSLVTKDIPNNVLAYGSPCKVVKAL